jgi:thioredoxin 1
MLHRLFGRKPKPPTLPLEDRSEDRAPTIPDSSSSASIAAVQEITDSDFARVVLQSDRVVVVDVWAEWCQPCEIVSLYVAWLARERGDAIVVAALDADTNPATCEAYAIMGLPTLLFFHQGVEVDRQVGLLSYEALQAKVDALLHK